MFEALQKKLNYYFSNIELLRSALDRSSYVGDPATAVTSHGGGAAAAAAAASSASGSTMLVGETVALMTATTSEGKEPVPSHEHLEFVGDRVLNLCIATILSRLHPTWTPHQLQKFYTHYTKNTDNLAPHGGPLYRIAKELDLESNLTLKADESLERAGLRGKLKSGKKTKEWLLSDHVEAVLGAIYRDANDDLKVVMPIIEALFEPLGLSSLDHDSLSEFGASGLAWSGVVDDEDTFEEFDAAGQKFVQLIAEGNNEELIKFDLKITDDVAINGFWVAVINRRANLIPHILAHYPIDLETVKTALVSEDLPNDIVIILTNYMIEVENKLAASHHHEDIDVAQVFLRLAAEGNHQLLILSDLKVDEETAKNGFLRAIDNKKGNIVPYIVRHYGIDEETIRVVLADAALPILIRNFLENHLKKMAVASVAAVRSGVTGRAALFGTLTPPDVTDLGAAAPAIGGAGVAVPKSYPMHKFYTAKSHPSY